MNPIAPRHSRNNMLSPRGSALLSTAAMILFAMLAPLFAQQSQFWYDENGNLRARAGAVPALPQIIAQPQDQVAAPGGSASFAVVAANTAGLTYQWRFNGADLPGTTRDVLLLTNVSGAIAGLYSVSLANSSGSVSSAPARLLLDSDRDGLADAWELNYFSGLGQVPGEDADGDGVSNVDEFLDGTDPTNKDSLYYRLTLWSDGGHVDVTPGSLKYTNGTVVSLVATALAPEIFHGWTGAAIARTNQISLVMTNHQTISAHFKPVVLTWAGGSGIWHQPTNWNPTLVPTAVDDVRIISGSTIALNEPAECKTLLLNGGNLSGPGALTIHENAVWSSGTMSGSGRTVIPAGATLALSGQSMSLQRVLDNGGTTLWSGTANILMNNGVITNRPGALFEVANAATLLMNGLPSRVDNAGIFRKSAGGTTSFSGVGFNNFSTVDVAAGTLALGGGGLNQGTMAFPAGTTLAFTSGAFTNSATIAGAGNLQASAGTVSLAGTVNLTGTHTFTGANVFMPGEYFCTNNTLTISGGAANFSGTGLVQPAILNLSGGSLAGTQNVTPLSAMTWSGGTMTGPGRTTIPQGVTLLMNNAQSMTLAGGRTLDNAGTIRWTGAGDMFVTGIVITNRPGALFQVENASDLSLPTGGLPSRFDNAGLFRKTSAGTNVVSSTMALNNYNQVDVQNGMLSLFGGGVNHGTMEFAANATLRFSGGTFTDLPGASIVGAGSFMMGGGTLNLSGLVNLLGNHTFSSGTATLSGNYFCTNNALTISGGTANFSGAGLVQPAVLDLTGGSLAGAQNVTPLSAMTWTGGTMTGLGRTTIPQGVTLLINNAPPVTLAGGRTLDNAGTIRWTGAGDIFVSGITITNRPGALFQVENASDLALPTGGLASRFDNAGTFRKTSVGTTALTALTAFNNYNLVELQSGLLSLFGGGLNHGTIEVAANTTLRFSGGMFTDLGSARMFGPGNLIMGGGTLNLAGLVNLSGDHTFISGTATLGGAYFCTNNILTISGGTAAFNGTGLVQPAAVNITSGTLSGSQNVTPTASIIWSGGTMSGTGRTVIPAGVTLLMTNSSVTLSGGRTLDNAGTVRWSGPAQIFSSNMVITNRPGALFQVEGAGGFGNVTGAGPSRFDNAGLFRKTSSATTSLNALTAFNNYGTVEVGRGTLATFGGYTSTTNATLLCSIGGLTAGTDFGRVQVSGTVNVSGKLAVQLANGFVPATGNTFAVLTAGTRTGAFTGFEFPTNTVTMALSNSATAVTVRVTEVKSTARPELYAPELVGTDLKLTWAAVSNQSYRVQYKPDLGAAQWTDLPGDVTSTGSTASKLDPVAPTGRFYRILVLP